MIRTLTIPGPLPGLNEIVDAARGNKFAAAHQKQTYTDIVAWSARAAKIPPMKKIKVTIRWFEPNKRRDWDNIEAGQKFIFDGLVQAGVLENDGWKQRGGEVVHLHDVDKANPRVEVELEELGV